METPLLKNIKTEPCDPHNEQLPIVGIEIKEESEIKIGEIDETTYLQGHVDSSKKVRNSNVFNFIEDATIHDQIVKEEPVFYDPANSQIFTYPETEEETSKSIEYSTSAIKSEFNDQEALMDDKIFQCFICRCETISIGLLKWHLQERHPCQPLPIHHSTKIQLKQRQEEKKKMVRKIVVDQNKPKKQHSKRAKAEIAQQKPDSDEQQPKSNDHSDKRLHECSYCYRKFISIRRVKNHERVHRNDQSFKCSICPKGYNTKSHFESHMNRHNGKKPYSCETCGMKFHSPFQLYRHKKAHSNGIVLGEPNTQQTKIVENVAPDDFATFRLFECYICRYRSSVGAVQIHMREKHTGKRLYHCKVCLKKFAHKSSVYKHKSTHSKKNRFECEICGKTLASAKGLTLHLETHKGEYKHECKYCHKNYTTKKILRSHIRTHIGIKPYECEYCKRGFLRQADMVRHTLIHTGVRPFKCDICQATFSRNHLLTDHKKNLHSANNSKRLKHVTI